MANVFVWCVNWLLRVLGCEWDVVKVLVCVVCVLCVLCVYCVLFVGY